MRSAAMLVAVVACACTEAPGTTVETKARSWPRARDVRPVSASKHVEVRPEASAATKPAATPTQRATTRTAALKRIVPPPLHDDTGKLLPQTRQRPDPESELLAMRARALWSAIVHDEPERARAFFFPEAAYEVVKDSKDARRDYETRLLKLFARDIRRARARLGADPERLRFDGIEIPRLDLRWMAPGDEYNRVGYWRVLGAQLRYRDAGGALRRLPITSLISWRGEWYVVHLDGFR